MRGDNHSVDPVDAVDQDRWVLQPKSSATASG